MPKGGRLTINCAPLPNRRVRVRVEDTGVGIAPENLAKIFELYYTTKERGHRRRVCRWCIARSRFTTARSTSNPRSGSGTTFIVVLPAAQSTIYNDGMMRVGRASCSLVLLTASLGACAAKAQVRTEARAAAARSAAAAAARRRRSTCRSRSRCPSRPPSSRPRRCGRRRGPPRPEQKPEPATTTPEPGGIRGASALRARR